MKKWMKMYLYIKKDKKQPFAFSFLFLGPFIAAFGLPLRQRKPLHSAKYPFLQIRILCCQIVNKLLDFFPLSMLIHRTAVCQHRQVLPGCKAIYRFFVNVEHGADWNNAGAIQICYRLKTADPALVDKRHEKCLHSVIIMMS